MSLKEKIDGNELDLSLNQLTEVPVKELAATTKATRLDISCNRIRSLPREFSTLTHLVKIDLSSNNLEELPDNFGNLYNLQYLDLYSNQLVTLPVSFCRLKKLIWLDLKNNPLEPKLKAIAGDCLDEKECQACAKKVVAYMQGLDSELEREKQKKLKIAREKEALEKAKVEKELEEQRRIKKSEREKRKAELKAKKEAQLLSEKDDMNDNENSSRLIENEHSKKTENLSAKGNFCLKVLVICVFAVCSLLFIFGSTEINFQNSFTNVNIKIFVQDALAILRVKSLEIFDWLKLHIPSVRENVLKIVHQYLILMTDYATYLEEVFSHYFHSFLYPKH